MKSVVHLTSAHPRNDVRIFVKMCVSLSSKFNVSLVVADGLKNSTIQEVRVYDVGAKVGGRISRMTRTTFKVYKKAISLNADIYHLHDPELLPIGLRLKKKGFRVIFDAHEDLPLQLKSKPYLGSLARWMFPKVLKLYERYSFPKFDCLIGATPSITNKLSKHNSNIWNINNYPILGELSVKVQWSSKQNEICYLGAISEIRGIKEVVGALSFLKNIRLNLAGNFSEPETKNATKALSGWSNVNELGLIDRHEAADVLASSKVGLVTFHPYPNHINAQPNKMFEYMSAGLPIVTSNFPLWKEVVEGNDCGICVNPLNSKEISAAIQFIFDNPEEAQRMGENGYKSVTSKYNWKAEEKKLFTIYEKLLND